MTRGTIWRIFKFTLAAVFVIVTYSYAFHAGSQEPKLDFKRNWPNWPDCELTTVARYPNEDGTYVAAI